MCAGLAEDAIRKGAEIGIETQSGMLGDALHGVGVCHPAEPCRRVCARAGRGGGVGTRTVPFTPESAPDRPDVCWNDEALLGGQVEQLIASAVAQGRSATQLARDLEAFVKPDAMMPDNWNDIYEGLPFAFHVDYNAKRLAVSALNHSYFQGAILAGRENPYAEFLHWELSRSHEIYDVCDTYMEHDEGLGKGNFALDNAPLPHPFCKCTWYLDSSKSLEEIGQELGEWLAGQLKTRSWKGRSGNGGKHPAYCCRRSPAVQKRQKDGRTAMRIGTTKRYENVRQAWTRKKSPRIRILPRNRWKTFASTCFCAFSPWIMVRRWNDLRLIIRRP